ncbi:hypothetical protein ANN_02460, partial [Periplaneta americana]
HAHITDFNIATVLENGQLATSMSGTKPYMAPEIFECAADECVGYGFPVDWWSLGVVAYEMFYGARPFDIHSATSVSEVRALFAAGAVYPRSSRASPGFVDLIDRLLCVRPGGRISSLEELRNVQCLHDINLEAVLEKRVKPSFTPPHDHLNCDPTFELEEMIVETRPLHKKKKRLAKQRSLREIQGSPSADLDGSGELMTERYIQHLPQFRVYNRERELARREREQKETAWEEELLEAMRASDPIGPTRTCSEDHESLSESASIASSDRAADSLKGQKRTVASEYSKHEGESKNKHCISTMATNVDEAVKTGFVCSFMKADQVERRHSDHTHTKEVLPQGRNTFTQSTITSSRDRMPQSKSQNKYDILTNKTNQYDSASPLQEADHCRSCPKLNNIEQSLPSPKSSSKLFCSHNINQESVTNKSRKKYSSMPKSVLSLDETSHKCQITDAKSTNHVCVQSHSSDSTGTQGLAFKTPCDTTHERRKDVRDDCKEHVQHRKGSNSLMQDRDCQNSNVVRKQNTDFVSKRSLNLT